MKGSTMKKTTAAVAAAATILLTGCATGTPEPEPTTVTETVSEPAPKPSTVTETVEPDPEPASNGGSDLVDSLLETVWTDTAEADRVSICDGMDLAPDMMIDVFMDEFYAGGDMDGVEIDRQQVQDFFMGKCGL